MNGIVTAILVSILILTFSAAPVSAQSPGPPNISLINKLNAATNQLNEIQGRLGNLLERTHPPDPGFPPNPCVDGQLTAMTLQLRGIYGRLDAAYAVYPDILPDPDGELGEALLGVRDGALGILGVIEQAPGPPVTENPESFINLVAATVQVQEWAESKLILGY